MVFNLFITMIKGNLNVMKAHSGVMHNNRIIVTVDPVLS